MVGDKQALCIVVTESPFPSCLDRYLEVLFPSPRVRVGTNRKDPTAQDVWWDPSACEYSVPISCAIRSALAPCLLSDELVINLPLSSPRMNDRQVVYGV